MAKEQNPDLESEKTLSVSGIKNMKKAEIMAQFKASKGVWKKESSCKAVLFLLAFNKNTDKKKITVAIPFKKEQDMRAEFADVKKSGLLPMKQVAGGTLRYDKEKEELVVEITKGGANLDKLQTLAGTVFSAIKLKLRVSVAANAELEVLNPAEGGDDDLADDAEENASAEAESTDNDSDEAETKPEKQQEQPTGPKVDPQFVQFKDEMMSLNTLVSKKVAELTAKIKGKKVEQGDQEELNALNASLDTFRQRFGAASDAVKQTLGKGVDNFKQFQDNTLPKLREAMLQQLNNNTNAANANNNTNEPGISPELEALLKNTDKLLNQVSSETSDATKTLQSIPKQKLASGKDLLNML